MKESLVPGIRHEQTWTVTEDMSPGHIAAKVLSTPSMVGLIEQACHRCLEPHLDEAESSVGVHINVSHFGPAHAGEEVTVSASVSEVGRRGKLVFEVEVLSPRGPISGGTHDRVVIDTARFGAG